MTAQILKRPKLVCAPTKRRQRMNLLVISTYVMEGIRQDALFYLKLLRTLVGHPDVGLIGPAVIPFASLFVVESHARLSESGWSGAHAFDEAELHSIRAARHRVKMLLSKKKDVGQLVAEFDAIVLAERQRFVGPHSGWLGPIKRWIQPDLGVSMIAGEVFSTTHATRFSFGMPLDEASLREASRLVARYCADVADAVGGTPENASFSKLSLGLVMKDIKSEAFYRRGDLGALELPWAGVVALILANVNFVRRVLRAVVSGESSAFVKVRVMTAFHAIESLRVVQDRLRSSGELPKVAADVLSKLATGEVRRLRRLSVLRDMLVHFKLREGKRVSVDLGYQEQLAALSQGMTESELGELADRVLATVAQVLAAGFDLGPHTFWYGAVGR